jgi:hypothetical protein
MSFYHKNYDCKFYLSNSEIFREATREVSSFHTNNILRSFPILRDAILKMV